MSLLSIENKAEVSFVGAMREATRLVGVARRKKRVSAFQNMLDLVDDDFKKLRFAGVDPMMDTEALSLVRCGLDPIEIANSYCLGFDHVAAYMTKLSCSRAVSEPLWKMLRAAGLRVCWAAVAQMPNHLVPLTGRRRAFDTTMKCTALQCRALEILAPRDKMFEVHISPNDRSYKLKKVRVRTTHFQVGTDYTNIDHLPERTMSLLAENEPRKTVIAKFIFEVGTVADGRGSSLDREEMRVVGDTITAMLETGSEIDDELEKVGFMRCGAVVNAIPIQPLDARVYSGDIEEDMLPLQNGSGELTCGILKKHAAVTCGLIRSCTKLGVGSGDVRRERLGISNHDSGSGREEEKEQRTLGEDVSDEEAGRWEPYVTRLSGELLPLGFGLPGDAHMVGRELLTQLVASRWSHVRVTNRATDRLTEYRDGILISGSTLSENLFVLRGDLELDYAQTLREFDENSDVNPGDLIDAICSARQLSGKELSVRETLKEVNYNLSTASLMFKAWIRISASRGFQLSGVMVGRRMRAYALRVISAAYASLGYSIENVSSPRWQEAQEMCQNVAPVSKVQIVWDVPVYLDGLMGRVQVEGSTTVCVGTGSRPGTKTGELKVTLDDIGIGHVLWMANDNPIRLGGIDEVSLTGPVQ